MQGRYHRITGVFTETWFDFSADLAIIANVLYVLHSKR